MGSVNKAILVGNLGRDAELRYTPGGAAVATLNLATTEAWNDKQGQRQEKTEWHRVVVWGKQVYVEGRIQTRQWDDKDGNKKYTTEIKADRLTLLGAGSGAAGAPSDRDQQPAFAAAAAGAEPIADDDIPFAWLLPLLVPALSRLWSSVVA